MFVPNTCCYNSDRCALKRTQAYQDIGASIELAGVWVCVCGVGGGGYSCMWLRRVLPISKELIADGDNQILQTRDVKAEGFPRQAGDIFWIKAWGNGAGGFSASGLIF